MRLLCGGSLQNLLYVAKERKKYRAIQTHGQVQVASARQPDGRKTPAHFRLHSIIHDLCQTASISACLELLIKASAITLGEKYRTYNVNMQNKRIIKWIFNWPRNLFFHNKLPRRLSSTPRYYYETRDVVSRWSMTTQSSPQHSWNFTNYYCVCKKSLRRR